MLYIFQHNSFQVVCNHPLLSPILRSIFSRSVDSFISTCINRQTAPCPSTRPSVLCVYLQLSFCTSQSSYSHAQSKKDKHYSVMYSFWGMVDHSHLHHTYQSQRIQLPEATTYSQETCMCCVKSEVFLLFLHCFLLLFFFGFLFFFSSLSKLFCFLCSTLALPLTSQVQSSHSPSIFEQRSIDLIPSLSSLLPPPPAKGSPSPLDCQIQPSLCLPSHNTSQNFTSTLHPLHSRVPIHHSLTSYPMHFKEKCQFDLIFTII